MTTAEQVILDLPDITMQIVTNDEIMEESVPRRSDVEPVLFQTQEGLWQIRIRNQGEYGKFDIPHISHHIIYADAGLVSILIGYCGTETTGRKHQYMNKGQFWRHYQVTDDGVWSRRNWQTLDEDDRKAILDAYEDESKTPDWARPPGRLKADIKAGKKTTMTTYKIVQVIDGRYYSVFKPEFEYVLGKQMCQEAKPQHGGGFYSYPDRKGLLESLRKHRLFNGAAYNRIYDTQLALLECEISGRIIHYDNGKWSSTYLLPMKVLNIFRLEDVIFQPLSFSASLPPPTLI